MNSRAPAEVALTGLSGLQEKRSDVSRTMLEFLVCTGGWGTMYRAVEPGRRAGWRGKMMGLV